MPNKPNKAAINPANIHILGVYLTDENSKDRKLNMIHEIEENFNDLVVNVVDAFFL